LLSNILWGLFIVLFAALIIFLEIRKPKKKDRSPFKEKTEQEKKIERAIELEKSRRGGPPMGGGD
jgi:hypothetical protein